MHSGGELRGRPLSHFPRSRFLMNFLTPDEADLRSVMRYDHTRQQDIDAAMVLLEPKAAKEEKARVM